MTGYYDYVLGLIPAALLGITTFLSVLGIPLTQAVPVGAGASILVMGHALFVNGPVEETSAPGTPSRTPLGPNAD